MYTALKGKFLGPIISNPLSTSKTEERNLYYVHTIKAVSFLFYVIWPTT
jgi:hypothetical protein